MFDKFNKTRLIGLLRVIVFAACSLTIVDSIYDLWGYATFGNPLGELYVPFVKYESVEFVRYLTFLATSSIGLYGACSGRPAPLKIFAGSEVVFTILYDRRRAMKLIATDWEEQTPEFERRMKVYANEYQFDVRPGEGANKATRVWDLVQKSMQCCGLESSDDWDRWTNNTQFPRSCCTAILDRFPLITSDCQSGGPIYTDGCNRLEAHASESLTKLGIGAAVSFLIALIAWFVAKARESSRRSSFPLGSSQSIYFA